jgi:hypothetical protein
MSIGGIGDGGRLVIGSEKPLLRVPSFRVHGVTPDGRRFLIGRLSEPEPARGIRVVLNGFDELKARVPANTSCSGPTRTRSASTTTTRSHTKAPTNI